MSVIFLLVSLIVVVANISSLPAVFGGIFRDAFDFQAIFGGFTGSCLMLGVKRSVYSNEAGTGSAPNAASSVECSHPVKQGLVQILSVFIDTLVICTATAMLCLFSGIEPSADFALACMCIVNIPIIVILSGKVTAAYKDYCRQKAEGKDPVFKASEIGIEGTDFWN